MLQIFYWMDVYEYLEDYGYYAVYYGLDYTQPLDEQTCQDTQGTWQQFFLDKALLNWHSYQALAKMAQAEGVTEELKAADPMRWTGLMNNIKQSAEETVLQELIYS